MEDPDFWDFMLEGGYDLLFPDDKDDTVKCENCGRTIKGSEKVGWVDKEKKIYKCPNCGSKVKINS